MSDDADRFRKSAANCRRLASEAADEGSRRELTDIAVELDAEADKIDDEEARLGRKMHGRELRH